MRVHSIEFICYHQPHPKRGHFSIQTHAQPPNLPPSSHPLQKTTASQDRGAFDYHILVGRGEVNFVSTPPSLLYYQVSSLLDRTRTTVDDKLRNWLSPNNIFCCGIFALNEVGGPNQTFLKFRRTRFLNKFAKWEEDKNHNTEFIYRV